ncbi:zinc finger protein [Thermus phage TSP4]|nr:zinc finger protein [Thermus phage TSP4]
MCLSIFASLLLVRQKLRSLHHQEGAFLSLEAGGAYKTYQGESIRRSVSHPAKKGPMTTDTSAMNKTSSIQLLVQLSAHLTAFFTVSRTLKVLFALTLVLVLQVFIQSLHAAPPWRSFPLLLKE